MKHRFILLLPLILLACCGVPKGRVRLSGNYENIKQGDFLVFSTDGGIDRIDTLHVDKGEFDYECPLLTDAATLCIAYPNHSQLMLWVEGGDHIRIEADVMDLWHTKVKGNDDNELFTEFRHQNAPNDTAALRRSASQFIHQHPESRVASYLLTQYFVNTDDVPLDSTDRLYRVIQQALPHDPSVAQLGGVIQNRYALREGIAMPAFDLVDTDSVHHTLAQYKGRPLVLYFWAGWNENSNYLHQQLSKLHGELLQPTDGVSRSVDVALLGYSLDVDSTSLHINIPGAALNIPTVCDFQGFSSPLASQLGIRTLPTFVIVDRNGRIQHIARTYREVEKKLKAKGA